MIFLAHTVSNMHGPRIFDQEDLTIKTSIKLVYYIFKICYDIKNRYLFPTDRHCRYRSPFPRLRSGTWRSYLHLVRLRASFPHRPRQNKNYHSASKMTKKNLEKTYLGKISVSFEVTRKWFSPSITNIVEP